MPSVPQDIKSLKNYTWKKDKDYWDVRMGSEIVWIWDIKKKISPLLLPVRPSVKLDAATILRNYINKYRNLMNSKPKGLWQL